MKSVLVVGALALGLTLIACGGSTSTTETAGSTSATATTSVTTSAVPSPSASPNTTPSTSPSTAQATQEEQAGTTLTYGGAAAKCVRPVQQKYLLEAELSFRGKVTSMVDGVVTVRVTDAFRGKPGKTVRLQSHDGMSEAPTFTEGASFFITARDGQMQDCLSGPTRDSSLKESYDLAFGTFEK
ncbi:hypothetical protein [Kineosporia succinea]|uniref:4-hydroxy-L-threonine phosphate dehydrogenase PdxA n=1 Tax=Kineosporia succinea TaxID=84632 RepID=A0ABT9NYX3_9ACTN|nr:hypothetical protein [Kineosporia succinea]MDP9825035.1 4-hydroxy-L-threonine phosphate dehydrogenase PdxA [Kineosporia succinea]